MDFADEPYVRKYTRKTATNRQLGWEGRAVQDAMLGEFDPAGVFDFRGDLVLAISAVTDIPVEIVRVALARLVETETWAVNGRCIIWPTFEEAQNCRRSDRLRKRASRRARLEQAATVAPPVQSNPVTSSHPTSPESPPVTLSHPPLAPLAPSAPSPCSLQPTVGARAREPDLTGETASHTDPVDPVDPEPAAEPPEPEPAPPEPVKAIAVVEPPKPKRKPKPTGRSWKRVPADWPGPNVEHRDRAFALGWTNDRLDREAEKYRLHDFKSPRDDPDRTFHRWIIKAEEIEPNLRNGNGGRTRGQGRNSDALEYAIGLGGGEST